MSKPTLSDSLELLRQRFEVYQTASKQARFHDWMSWISALRYNFLHAQRGLRRRADDGRWECRTPAMAVGLAEPRDSTVELLRLCPVGLG